LRQRLQAVREMPQIPITFIRGTEKDSGMEQGTPTVIPERNAAWVINTRGDRPYVEIWDGDHLLLAGWVYDEPNYITPFTPEQLDKLKRPFGDIKGPSINGTDVNVNRPPADQPPTPETRRLFDLFETEEL
jgi:hypothetical protein